MENTDAGKTGAGVDIIRFRDPSRRTVAVLASNGRLALKDDAGSIELYEDWRNFVKKVMGQAPVKAVSPDEAQVIEQIALGLSASAEKIQRKEVATVAKKSAGKPKAEPKPKAEVEPKECPSCLCGCGDQVGKPTSRFIPGHDAKFHSMLKRYERGELPASELPASVRKFADANSIKPQGKKPKK